MGSPELIVRRSGYPERPETAPGAVERLVGEIGYRLHTGFARGPRDFTLLTQAVQGYRARFAKGTLAPRVLEMRYQLRRGRLDARLLPEVLALAATAVETATGEFPDAQAIGAAQLLFEGRLVDLPDESRRRQAVACAAIVFAVCGVPAHVVCASDLLARHRAAALREILALPGFSVGCITQGMEPQAKREAYAADITCGSHREIAHDYLRDRLMLGNRQHGIRGLIDQLSGDAPPVDQLLMRGLQCAIVEDADLVMIDDARVPLVISAESDNTQERLLYEQAVELANALRADVDFQIEENEISLSAGGSGRLARLVQPLGGIWGGQQRRETLICEALTALHLLENGRDYQVQNGRIVLSEPGPDEAEDDPADLELRAKLLEVKEGLKLSGRRDILARLSVPRFFSRYSRLCGISSDASGLESEFWQMYRLKCERASPPAQKARPRVRAFSNQGAKRGAILAAVHEAVARGHAVVVAVRTPAFADEVVGLLAETGIDPQQLRGTGDTQEQAILAAVHTPGAVTVSLHPAERSIALACASPVHLVVGELHDARRHVERLLRAYDAADCELMVSLDEDMLSVQVKNYEHGLLTLASSKSGELPGGLAKGLYRLGQRRLERAHSHLRAETMSFDRYIGDLLAFTGVRD
ncbi:MAG: hypothetical protein WDZ63_01765 [Burkholderiales bacterium]